MTPLGYVKGAAAMLLLSLVFWGGCSTQKNIDSANVNKARAEKVALERRLDKQAKENAEKLLAEQTAKQKELAAVDEKNTKEKERAKEDYERTIANLRNGNLELRKRFVCPKANPTVPSTGVGDGKEESGLQREDAEFLLSEAERADEVARQLTAAQEIIDTLLKRQK